MGKFKRLTLIGGYTMTACLSCPALAQSAASPPEGQPDSIADIVVTARQRSETLISVPVAVTALSAQQISRYKSDDLSKIGEMVPSVIVGVNKANGGATIAIRGISTPANTSGFEQAVSVAIDGVQTSNGRIAQLSFFDLAQVEVLEGPQALFFGKNSPAGVISVKTAMPTDRLSFSAKETYEFVADETVTEAAISGPLTDTLSARLAGRYTHSQGWLYNDARARPNPFYIPTTAGGAPVPAGAATLPGAASTRVWDEGYQGRLTLQYKPVSNVTAVLKIFGFHSSDPGSGVASQAIGCAGPNPITAGVIDTAADCKADNHTSNSDLSPTISSTMPEGNTSGQSYGRLTAWIGSFTLNVDLGKINVAALTGFNSIKSEAQFGFDQSAFSQLAVIEQPKIREFSQQIRVTTQLDGPINFMVGAYYQKLTNTQYNNLKLSDRAYNGTTGRFDSAETFGEQHGRTVSAFGQAIFNVTEQLELAGGARWTNERKSAKVHNLFGVGAFNTLTTTYAGSDTVGELQGNYDDNNISPEATLTWRPDRDHTIYAAYKTAFKSGGFTLAPIQTTTTINDQNFGPERVKGFEVGAKGLFADRKLRATFTAFAYDFNGQQVSIYDLTNLRFIITNAGSVRQRGASAGLEFTPNRALQLHTAMTYVHNRFAGFTGQCYGYPFVAGTTVATAVPPPHCSLVPGGGLALQQTYDGRAPARSPEFTANLGAAYTVALNSRSTLDLTGDAFYSDSYHAADNLNPNSRQDAFWRLNASVTLNLDDNRWHVSFIGRNLTNQYYLQFASDRSGGASTPLRASEVRATVARGRELALQVGLNL